ncbi:hypothetical protein ACVW0P_003785 [Mucilaginibacter sp. UYNi724]
MRWPNKLMSTTAFANKATMVVSAGSVSKVVMMFVCFNTTKVYQTQTF